MDLSTTIFLILFGAGIFISILLIGVALIVFYLIKNYIPVNKGVLLVAIILTVLNFVVVDPIPIIDEALLMLVTAQQVVGLIK